MEADEMTGERRRGWRVLRRLLDGLRNRTAGDHIRPLRPFGLGSGRIDADFKVIS
jgi:hypothetical protein